MKALHSIMVKMPSIQPFDGTSNPNSHLDVYKAQMYVQNLDDATCYQYFPAMSKGIMQKWFNSLPNERITSFLQLAELSNAHSK